jgi:DNA-binding winged helix-turn-helix (wHTH) protein
VLWNSRQASTLRTRGYALELRLRGCLVDLQKRLVTTDTTTSALTTREVDLLTFLAASPNTPFPDHELLREVWGYRPSVISRAVDQLLYRLRKKVEINPSHPEHLVKVYGEGLKYVPMAGLIAEPPTKTRAPNVPTWHARFYGRTEVLDLLEVQQKRGGVVAVTGLSGIGKTRLVTHWLERVATGRRWFVELPADADLNAVLHAIATAVDIPSQGESAIHTALRLGGPTTLVLDDLPTQRGEVAEFLGRLTRHGNLSVVYTALRPLGTPWERVVVVPPLGVEAAGDMFLEHADAAGARGTILSTDPHFKPLIKVLGGHPLAIALCASRARVLSLRDMQTRLCAMSTGRQANVAMEQALSASWQLLDLQLQQALARLCVFPDGTDAAGAEALFSDLGGLTALDELVVAGFVMVSPSTLVPDAMWIRVPNAVLAYVAHRISPAQRATAIGQMTNRLLTLRVRIGHTEHRDHRLAGAHRSACDAARTENPPPHVLVHLALLAATAALKRPPAQRYAAFTRLGEIQAHLTPDDVATYLGLRVVTAPALESKGSIQNALEQLDELSTADRMSVIHYLGAVISRAGDAKRSWQLMKDTLETWDGEQVPLLPRVRLWTAYAWRCLEQATGQELLAAATVAVELSARLGEPFRECRARSVLGLALYESGRIEAGIQALRAAVAVGVPGHLQTREAEANLGHVLCEVGRLDEGLPLMRELADGDPPEWNLRGKATSLLGVVQFVEPEEAIERLLLVERLMQDERMLSVEVMAAAEWAIAKAGSSPDQARAHLERAQALAREQHLSPTSPTARRIEYAQRLLTPS